MLKKIIISILFLVIIGVAVSYYYVNNYLPQKIAESIVNEEENDAVFVPKRIKSKISKGKKAMQGNIQLVEKELDNLNLTIDDLIVIIDEVKPKEVIKTIEILNQTEIKSSNQVFDIAKNNIEVNHVDVEVFRDSFNKYASVPRIKKGLKKINETDVLMNMSVSVARQTAKSILLERKDKIFNELNKINREQTE